MKQIQLSAAQWDSPRAAHEALKEALSFPDYYGHNLDALYDCLTDLDDTLLIIEECAKASQQIGEKWSAFLTVFLDAAQNNPGLESKLLPGSGDYI